MPNDETRFKCLSLAEANALLPQVRMTLKNLRDLRAAILRAQAQVEIEEMTQTSPEGTLSPAGQAAVTQLMEGLHFNSKQFEEKLEEMIKSGAQLKDLDQGLVDFFSLQGKEVISLCWKEGEEEITHWHSLEGGFRNRRPIEPPLF